MTETLDVAVYCLSCAPFLTQSIAGKSRAMQVNCTVLPGHRDSSGLTSKDTFEVNVRDLWTPAINYW